MATIKSIRSFTLIAAIAFSAAALPLFQAHAAQFRISVSFGGPPALPVYVQPIPPDEGYIWTPGYWAYDDQDGYYWVPGVWVLPPQPGLLWTPGYWAFDDDAQSYVWNEGYWAPEVGFYGGINYGFGYDGDGYDGGYWQGGFFYYNTRVTRIGRGFGHVYDRPVHFRNHTTISFNGGHGGLTFRPTDRDQQAIHDHHLPPTQNQRTHQGFAGQNHDQFAKFNNGRPSVPAAASVNSFHDHPSDPNGAARPTRGNNNQPQPNQPQPSQPSGNNNPRPDGGGRNPGNTTPQQQPNQPANNPRPDRMDRGGTVNQPRPNNQPQPGNQPQPQPENQTQPRFQPRPDNQPQPQQQPQQPRPETQPRPQPQQQPQPRPETQPRPDNQPRPQPQAQQPRPDTHTESHHEAPTHTDPH